jgi:hypothetical protein
MLLARSALECGSLLPLLRLEPARAAAGSKLPAKESGSKLPHSKKVNFTALEPHVLGLLTSSPLPADMKSCSIFTARQPLDGPVTNRTHLP